MTLRIFKVICSDAEQDGWHVQTQMQRSCSEWLEKSSFSGPNPMWVCLFCHLVAVHVLYCTHSHTFFTCLLQNFKREEQNFVVINEINNMSFLTADSKSKMSKVRWDKTDPVLQQVWYSVTPWIRKNHSLLNVFFLSAFIFVTILKLFFTFYSHLRSFVQL